MVDLSKAIFPHNELALRTKSDAAKEVDEIRKNIHDWTIFTNCIIVLAIACLVTSCITSSLPWYVLVRHAMALVCITAGLHYSNLVGGSRLITAYHKLGVGVLIATDRASRWTLTRLQLPTAVLWRRQACYAVVGLTISVVNLVLQLV